VIRENFCERWEIVKEIFVVWKILVNAESANGNFLSVRVFFVSWKFFRHYKIFIIPKICSISQIFHVTNALLGKIYLYHTLFHLTKNLQHTQILNLANFLHNKIFSTSQKILHFTNFYLTTIISQKNSALYKFLPCHKNFLTLRRFFNATELFLHSAIFLSQKICSIQNLFYNARTFTFFHILQNFNLRCSVDS
jgi:hypothetical protein